MLFTCLSKIKEKMDMKSTFLRYCFWINDCLKGSPIRRPYAEIKWICEHDEETTRKVRSRKLDEILEYACSNTSFYARYIGKGINHFPVMDKGALIENAEAISVPLSKIPNQKGEVYIQKTSGSTGIPLAIPQDTQKRQRRIADLKYFGQLVGYKTHEPLIHLRIWNKWQKKTQKQISRENIFPFDCSDLSDERLHELCDLIIRTKAVAIRAYASCLDLLAKFVKRNPHYVFQNLKIAFSTSEMLHDDTRANVKRYLKCEIISQYADEECGIIAQERIPTKEDNNVMYLNYADYYIEFLKLESDEPAGFGDLARIVITDLHNHAFPIIRYDCGDTGELMPPDEHSRGYPVLGKLYGRKMDMVYTTSGVPFSPMLLGRTVKNFNVIKQWQFIQKGERNYVLKTILEEGGNVEELGSLLDELKHTIGIDATISIEVVNNIPLLKSGKRKVVVNEWCK